MKDFNNLDLWLLPHIERTGLSIEDFAKAVKISRSQLYRYFIDASRPTVQTMARICHFLHVPLEVGLKQYTDKKAGFPKGQERNGRRGLSIG